MSTLPDLTALIAEVERTAGPAKLDRLSSAETVAAELNALGMRLIGYFVEQARVDGHSWTDIGTHAGVTKQAAQQRYAPPRFRLTVSDLIKAGALVHLTARTRDALTRAEQYAVRGGSPAVEPRHLLLAILDDSDTLGVQALERLGVDRAALRADLGPDPADPPAHPAPTGTPPLSAPGRRVLETAATQALKLGHNYVGTEHLLLGLAQDPILADRAVGFDQVHEAVLAVVDAYLRRR